MDNWRAFRIRRFKKSPHDEKCRLLYSLTGWESSNKYILEKEGYEAEDAVMIDDLEENLEGARGVGMKTFHLTPEFDRKNLYSSLLSL